MTTVARDNGPITVARIHDGRMTSACCFTAREVGSALAYIASVRSAGDSVNVTVQRRADGTGVNDLDRTKLFGAADDSYLDTKRRRRK